jgi:beta-glucanase (GH16 family)
VKKSANRIRGRRTSASVVERLEVRQLFAAPGANWKLVWSDEFNGTHLTGSKWNVGKPWAGPDGTNGDPDAGTISYFTPNNVSVSGGMLHLTASQQSVTDSAGNTFNYTAGFVNTDGKFQMSSGYVEIRAQIPTDPGLWPAFWMVSNGWPPEDDVAEFVTGQNRFHQGLAYGSSANVQWDSMDQFTPLQGGFHTYGMQWGPGYQIFTMDGIITHVARGAHVPTVPMYLLLSTGVSQTFPPNGSTVFPNSFDVDYVRVYQRNATPELSYGGFEGGDLGLWQGHANAVVTTDNPHSGTYALRLQGETSSAQQTITGLQPNTMYVLTAYAAAADGNQGTVGVNGYGGADVSAVTSGSVYAPIRLTFKTGRTNHSAVVYGLQSYGSGYVWIDDVAIHQAATIQNPGFELAGLGAWNASGSASVVSGHAHSGNFALADIAAGDQADQVLYGLSPNTTYRLTAWVRVGSADARAQLSVIDDSGAETDFTSSAMRYKRISLTFTTSATSTSATIFCTNLVGGGPVWFDDLQLTVPHIPAQKAPRRPG